MRCIGKNRDNRAAKLMIFVKCQKNVTLERIGLFCCGDVEVRNKALVEQASMAVCHLWDMTA